jgi:hypothetical protein
MPFPAGLVLYLMALRSEIPLLAVHRHSSHAVTGAVDIAVDNFVDDSLPAVDSGTWKQGFARAMCSVD